MIDLDRMDAQLAAAMTDVARPPRVAARSAPVPAPTPAPAPPSPPSHHAPRRIRADQPAPAATLVELLEAARIDEVDARIAATTVGRDRVTWATMRDLLAGRSAAADAGIRELAGLGRAGDPEAGDRAWTQRFWAAFEWGPVAERHDVLDHCRDRAYRFDELHWWGNLTLLLAAMGKADEASRAFDSALPMVAGAAGLDLVTNLVDAAALLGDAGRVVAAGRHLPARPGRLVVVGDGLLCKGSVDRYSGLINAALGRSTPAAECFRRAEEVHRDLGAAPLLARTRRQASGALVAA